MEATETDPSKFMPNSTWAAQSQGIQCPLKRVDLDLQIRLAEGEEFRGTADITRIPEGVAVQGFWVFRVQV